MSDHKTNGPHELVHKEYLKQLLDENELLRKENARMRLALKGAELVFGGLLSMSRGQPESMIYEEHLREIKLALNPGEERE